MKKLSLSSLKALPALLVLAGLMATSANAAQYEYRKPTQNLTVATAPVVPVCTPGSVSFVDAGSSSWTPPAGCTTATFKVWGAGGGSSPSATGGGGGFVGGTLDLASVGALTIVVGGGGAADNTRSVTSGGGYSAVMEGAVPVLVAGGGAGGGQGSPGGAGGGVTGQTTGAILSGAGATQTGGGGSCDAAGGAKWAGAAPAAIGAGVWVGSGGHGYFGGGAGCSIMWSNMRLGTPGGGGSGFVAPTLLSPQQAMGGLSVPGNSYDADRGSAGSPQSAGKVLISYQ